MEGLTISFTTCVPTKVSDGHYQLELKYSFSSPTVTRYYWISSVSLKRSNSGSAEYVSGNVDHRLAVHGSNDLVTFLLTGINMTTPSGTSPVKLGDTITLESKFQSSESFVQAELNYRRDVCSPFGYEYWTVPLATVWGHTTSANETVTGTIRTLDTKILVPSDYPCSKFMEFTNLTVVNSALQVIKMNLNPTLRLETHQ